MKANEKLNVIQKLEIVTEAGNNLDLANYESRDSQI